MRAIALPHDGRRMAGHGHETPPARHLVLLGGCRRSPGTGFTLGAAVLAACACHMSLFAVRTQGRAGTAGWSRRRWPRKADLSGLGLEAWSCCPRKRAAVPFSAARSGRCGEAWVIAVGDVQLEIMLCLTLRGTVRELAAFMEALTSSELVVGFGHGRRDGDERERISNFCKQVCSDTGERKR